VSGASGRGPNPMANCSVCRSNQLGYINSLVIAGTPSMKQIAANTGVSYDAIRRHTKNDHDGFVSASKPATTTASSTPLPAGSSPVDVMRRTLDDLAATDISKLPARAQAAHAESVRRVAESLARMDPSDSGPIEVRVADVPGLEGFLGDLLLILNEFPQIRARVAASMTEHGLMSERRPTDVPTKEAA
jgi:hypothetical protein